MKNAYQQTLAVCSNRQESNSREAGRHVAVDVARGALLLYIVAGVHGVFWMNLLPFDIASIMLFEMPCIFIVSGFSYSLYEHGHPSIAFRLNNYMAYLKVRAARILVPYITYVAACILICLILKYTQKKPDASACEIILSWLNPVHPGWRCFVQKLHCHLWFIAPFFVVTAILPIATRFQFQAKVPLWVIMAAFTLVIFGISKLPLDVFFLQTTAFYLGWAVFGYYLNDRIKPSAMDYLTIFSLAAISLLLARSFFSVHLNMQANKFPPNWVFVLFSCAWVSVILWLTPHLSARQIDFLASRIWLRPFIKNGYSIFLWHGLGYTLAQILGKILHLPIALVWLMSIMVAIGLGILMSPFERLRFKYVK